MTEAEWLACTYPADMMDFIAPTAGGLRKERLFGVACCRRIWSLIAVRVQGCVEVAERYADDEATGDELHAAKGIALARWLESDGTDAAAQACEWVCGETVDARLFLPPAIRAAVQPRLKARGWVAGQELTEADTALFDVENAEQLRLIHDIFGNPFRPVSVNPDWLSSSVVALAEGIYAERAFERMPVLADALEDSGCAHADILTHCRSDGPHTRGCWVVDLLLGKE